MTSSRGKRWLIGGVAVWALAIAGAAAVSSHRDEPTVRDQTTVDQARHGVDRVVAGVVAIASDSADVVVIVSPFTRTGSCRISPGRPGQAWEQALVLYARPGAEADLLDRIGAPFGAKARRPNGKSPSLRADAGDYLRLTGGVARPGEVRVTADTGCRPGTYGGGDVGGGVAEPEPAARALVDAALTALSIQPVQWRSDLVSCPSGGALRVVSAVSERGVVPGPLPASLMAVGPDAVMSEAEVYAYRAGPVSVVARIRDGIVSVTSTTPC